MLSFETPKDKVKNTIHNFCKNLKMCEEMENQILRSVDDYSSTIDQQVKMDIIEDNLSVLSSVEIGDRNIVRLIYFKIGLYYYQKYYG
jgi:hypothetical protein